MHKKLIVLGITDNWSFAAGTVLYGLKEHLHTEYDVRIMHNGLSDKNQKLLSEIVPNVSFERFDESLIESEKFTERFSKMTFSRFECFRFLSEYESVLWLDTDILIKKDITDIFSFTDTPVVAYQRHGLLREDFDNPTPFTNYDLDRDGYNCGVLLLHNTLEDPEKIRRWCYDFANTYSKEISSADQPVLNLAFQKFNISVTPLPQKFNCSPRKKTEETAITHPTRNKYWEHRIDPVWEKYIRKWKKQGGDSPEIPHTLKRRVIYVLWKLGIDTNIRKIIKKLRK